ncbi:MAG: hypothetical protein J6Y69_09015 [Treponema sp.]|nr:hypothetical protein [Treponema sp.]
MKKIVVFPVLILLGFMLMSCQTTDKASSKSNVYKPGELINGKDGKPVLYRNRSLDIAIDILPSAIILSTDSLSMFGSNTQNVDFIMSHYDLTGTTLMMAVEDMGEVYASLDDDTFTRELMENPVFVATYTEQFAQSLSSKGYTVEDVYVEELEFMGEEILAFRLEGSMASMPMDYVVIFTKVGRYLRCIVLGATKHEYVLDQIGRIGHYR